MGHLTCTEYKIVPIRGPLYDQRLSFDAPASRLAEATLWTQFARWGITLMDA